MSKSAQVGRLSFFIDAVALIASVCLAFVYIVSSNKLYHQANDWPFVALLTFATVFVVWATQNLRSYIITRGFSYWQYVLQEAEGEEIESALRQLMVRFFPSIRRIVAGILYGLLLAVGVNEIMTIPGGLRIEYGALLFTVNYITGATLYSLVVFLSVVPALIRNIPVQLWEARNPAAEFLFGATSRVGVFASVYVGLCMTSILFSGIPTDVLVVAYVIFSVVMALATVVAPFYFYARRIQFGKNKILIRIGVRLNELSGQILEDGGQRAHSNEFRRMQELAQLREWIAGVEVFPFKLRSIYTGLTIILFTLQPLAADLIKDAVKRFL